MMPNPSRNDKTISMIFPVTGKVKDPLATSNGGGNNPEEKSAMSSRAIDYVRKNHDIRDKADQYIALFNDLLNRS